MLAGLTAREWGIAALIAIIIVLLLAHAGGAFAALVAAAAGRTPLDAPHGGAPGDTPPGEARHDPGFERAEVDATLRLLSQPDDAIAERLDAPDAPPPGGGAPSGASPIAWSDFPSWAALRRDRAAAGVYMAEAAAFRARLAAGRKLDWSGVCAALGAELDAPTECIGLINQTAR